MAQNPFLIDQGSFMPGVSMLARGMQVGQAKDERAAALQRQQDRQQAMLTAFEGARGNTQNLINVAAQYPELSKVVDAQIGFSNEKTQSLADDMAAKIFATNDPAKAAEIAEEYSSQILEAGGSPINLGQSIIGLRSEDSEEAMNELSSIKDIFTIRNKELGDRRLAIEGAGAKGRELNIKEEGLKLRKEEADLRRLEQEAERESNELKKDELKLKIADRQQKIDEKKKEVAAGEAQAITAVDNNLAAIDRLLSHPGLEAAVGATLTPGFTIPGTDKADFEAELESFDAKNFLTSIKQMTGMGSLSDAEGKRISAAVGAINPSMSEKAFKNSLNIIKKGLLSAKDRMPKPEGMADVTDASKGSSIDDLVSKYAD